MIKLNLWNKNEVNMTKYYSNNPDFSSGLQGDSTAVSVSYARSQVTNSLSDIKEVTEVVQNEGLSYLYVPEGDAELGEEMPESTFTTSYDTVERMLNLATRIHSEVLERIDNKFTTGIDASLESLNSVNGSNNPYTTTHLSYQVIKMKSETQGIAGTETKYYTLAELLNYETSPLEATKEVYLQRVKELRKQFESTSLEMDEDVKLALFGGPSNLSNKTDEDLLSMFFEYTQIGNYSRLKYFQWQEDNKEWLEPLEQYLGVALLAVAVIASVVSVGAASPTVVAAATAVATTTTVAGAAYGAVEGGYAAATGRTMISGTEINTDDRLWAAAEAVASVATFGLGKAVKVAGATDDIVNAVNRTTNAVDDGVNLSHIAYNTAVKGEDPTLSLVGFGAGKVVGKLAGITKEKNQVKANLDINKGETEFVDGHFTNPELETKYRQYLDKQHRTGEQALEPLDWKRKNDLMTSNREKGRQFEIEKLKAFKETADNVEEQVTIAVTGPSGETVRTRIDAMGYDKETGSLVIHEYKSSPTAPLTANQEKAFEMIRGGAKAVVVGKGKGVFKGGFELPEGTEITVIRP